MTTITSRNAVGVGAATLIGLLLGVCPLSADLNLGPEEFVTAGGTDIDVPGYSVPSLTHWDGDDLEDLIVGEGGGGYPGKVRVYLNVGTAQAPLFSDYLHAQSEGADLVCAASGCMGIFPRVVYWDADDRKDLLAGLADGRIMIFLNVGTDDEPTFDGGTFLQVGEPGAKVDIQVLARATPSAVDWDNDGRKDLVTGSYLGLIHIFINEGTDTAPDFRTERYALADGWELSVPSARSSPVVCDLDDDGKKDLLTGNTEGQLLFYANVGTDEEPTFSDFVMVESDGVAIDLPDTPRSRPSVCDWTGDGLVDVLIGAADGKVHLYRGVCAADLDGDGATELTDLAILLAAYGTSTGDPHFNPVADLDGDAYVGASDLAILLASYGCNEVR